MLEFFIIAAVVLAGVAMGRANKALTENVQLKAELLSIRRRLEALQGPAPDDQQDPAVANRSSDHATEIAADMPAGTSAIVSARTPDKVQEAAHDAVHDTVLGAALPPISQAPLDQVSDARFGSDAPKLESEAPTLQPEAAGDFPPVVDTAPAEPVSEPEAPATSVAASVADAGAPVRPVAQSPGGDAERAFATKWTVWIGGIALAMGGLLIVRYGIEAGFFGPVVRLLMGAAFAVTVAAISEFLRRRDLKLNMRASYADQIPAVLAGVSVLSAFGVVYAAHAVYGMISAGPAFALMAAIGLSALAASLLHGPRFGLFGLIGSYATPIMVSATAPNYMALSVFIAIVTSAAFLLQFRRPSNALVVGAVLGHALWTGLIGLDPSASGWGSFLLIVAITLATLHVESAARLRGPHEIVSAKWDVWAALVAFACPLVLAGVLWVENGGNLSARVALIMIVGGNICAALRHRGLAPLAPLAGAAAVGLILLWPDVSGPLRVTPQTVFDLLRLDLVPSAAPGLALFAVLFSALVSLPLLASLFVPWRNGAGDAVSRGCLAFASALAPVCMMLSASLRLNGFNRTMGFAIIAAVLAVLCAVVSEFLFRREHERAANAADPLSFVGSAAFAAAGAIAVGLAIAFALRETWLVVGFAVASGGVALVARSRPIPLLRSITAALGTAALARVVWQPTLTDVGNWPLLNWLLVVYGLPALAFGVAAWALADRRDRARTVVEALAALFLSVVVVLELVQAFAGSNLWDVVSLFTYEADQARAAGRDNRATAFVALLTLVMALLAALFMSLKRATQSPVFAVAEKFLSAAILPLAIAVLGVFLNPIFAGAPVLEPPILNRLLFGYVGLAAGLAVLANALPRREADNRLQLLLEALAIILGVLGAVLVLRHCFTGPIMSVRNAASVGFYESVSTTLLLLVLAAVVAFWRDKRESATLRGGFWCVAALAAGHAAVMLGLAKNPILDRSMVEGPILFNRILWGYAPVAIGFIVLARMAGRQMGALYLFLLSAGAATALLMTFLLLRHGFHGPTLFSALPITLAEAGIYGSLAVFGAFLKSYLRQPRAATEQDQHADVMLAVLAVVLHGVVLAIAILGGARLAGWPLLNNSIPALLLPATLAGMMSLWCRSAGLKPFVSRLYGVAAVAGGVIYALLQIRFAFHGVTLASDLLVTLAEAGTYGCLALITAFIASRALISRGAPNEHQAPVGLCAVLSVGVMGILLGIAVLSGATIVGWPLLNNAILGLLAPSILAAAISLWSRQAVTAAIVSRIYGVAAVLGGLVYVIWQVRFALADSDGIEDWISGNHKARLFGYSFVIMAYGIALLVAGFRYAHRDLRIAALGVVGLAVLKVFLLDLAGLEGLWRAMSFIGLAAGLFGIAYLYRWLEPRGGERPQR